MDLCSRFSGLAFYCGSSVADNECCFNHLIGLPEKWGRECPIHDYQLNIFHDLEVDGRKYLWIKKATGLGITEFFLRYILWLAVCKNKIYKNTKFCIVTGPREKLTITLIERIKTMLLRLNIFSDTENTVAEVLGVKIEAFPSNHLDSMRGLTDVSFVFLDEADFFEKAQQEEARAIAERYIAKSNPHIVMVSTPNIPGGLFEKMENDRTPNFIYHRIHLPWQVGLGKIYTPEEIEMAKRSPSFEREYNLKYGFGVGNLFIAEQIDRAIIDEDKSADYDNLVAQNIGATVSIGIDPGFGSSKFAIVVATELDGKLYVVHAEEHEKADFVDMQIRCSQLVVRYNAEKVYVDAMNPELIRSLKADVNENPEYDKVMAQCKHDKIAPGERMKIVPTNFATEGLSMLTWLISLVSNELIYIKRDAVELIQQMRIAKTLPTGKLDKYKSAATMDSLDALMLAASLWKLR